jgi:hypothetical protein
VVEGTTATAIVDEEEEEEEEFLVIIPIDENDTFSKNGFKVGMLINLHLLLISPPLPLLRAAGVMVSSAPVLRDGHGHGALSSSRSSD